MKMVVSAMVLSLASGVAARGAEVPRISTAEGLGGQVATHLGTGWDVRVGLRMPGKEAGPYMVMYADCVAKAAVEIPHDRDPRQWLGPLFVRAEWGEAQVDMLRVDAARKMSDGLYAISIPVRKGICHLIVDDGSKTMWEERIKFEEVPASPWQPFVGATHQKTPDVRASDEAWAVIPKFSGDQPLLDFGSFAAAHSDAETLFKKSLPLTMPLEAGWLAPVEGGKAGEPALVLGMAGEQFTLVAAGRKMIDAPDEVLLARWWVNGKASMPAEVEGAKRMKDALRRLQDTEKFAVAFGYPTSLHAKEGDTLGLQVLYAPQGYEEVASGALLEMAEEIKGGSEMPMLSNKLEFKLSKEMVDMEAKAAVGN